ncbi:MAG: hypothetical protein WA991_03840 [Ornithinimicrobium sp.]
MMDETPNQDPGTKQDQRRDEYVKEQLIQARNLDTTITHAAAAILAERLSSGHGSIALLADTGFVHVEALKVELGIALAFADSDEAESAAEGLAEYVMAQPAEGREALEDWQQRIDTQSGEQYCLVTEHLGQSLTSREWGACYIGTYASREEYVAEAVDELGYSRTLETLLESSELPEDIRRHVEIDCESLFQDWRLSGEIDMLQMDDGRLVILRNRW